MNEHTPTVQQRLPVVQIVALCLGYFLILLDVTIVNVALPSMGQDLGLAGSRLAWVVDAYAIFLAALMLAAGAIGDKLGHRTIVIAGFVFFGLASIICAIAPTAAILIAARALQGIGAALCLPGTLALLTEMAPNEEAKSRLVGVWAAIGGAALPAGPLLGGILVSALGWRSVFWINVPLIAFAVIALLSGSSDRDADRSQPVDWGGAALLTTAVATGIMAIIEATENGLVAAIAAVISISAAIAFLAVERHTAHPLLPVPHAQRAALAWAAGVAGIMNLCAQGSLFVLTQLIQTVHGKSPVIAGVIMLPAFLPLPLLGTPAGKLVDIIGAWRTSAIGLIIGAAGFAITAANPGSISTLLLIGLLLWGIGLGVLTPGIVSAAIQAVPGSSGVASGASNTARQLGGAIGVALFAAVAGSPQTQAFLGHMQWVLYAAATAFVIAAGISLKRAKQKQES